MGEFTDDVSATENSRLKPSTLSNEKNTRLDYLNVKQNPS